MTDATQPASESANAARQRLDRLDGFLRQDPSNNALLIDAFETALACGEWERARIHLQQGRTLATEPLAWRLREGDFWLAQQRYDAALHVLQSLAQTPKPPDGFAAVLLHNMAFVELKQGRHRDCVARLAPTLEAAADASSGFGAVPSVTARALQQLWLRALHHDGQLARAIDWAREAERQHRLDAQAAGVASLVAIDVSDFATAERWSASSLADGNAQDHPAEVLVTRASLALSEGNVQLATQFADAALQRQPEDGRAWSTRGFVALLAGDLVSARAAFVHALSAGMATHIGTWHGLAWTQILQGDLPSAHTSFETALALDRNIAESQGGLAVVLAMMQRRPDAEAHAALALRLDKRNLSGRYAKALLSGEVGDAEDLQRLAKRLLAGRAAPLGGDMADLLKPRSL